LRRFKKGEIPKLKYKRAIKKPVKVRCIEINEPFEVETMEGVLRGKKGDYLMIGVNGEMYPIDKKIFLKTYDVIDKE
jgi:hypothetical protein